MFTAITPIGLRIGAGFQAQPPGGGGELEKTESNGFFWSRHGVNLSKMECEMTVVTVVTVVTVITVVDE